MGDLRNSTRKHLEFLHDIGEDVDKTVEDEDMTVEETHLEDYPERLLVDETDCLDGFSTAAACYEQAKSGKGEQNCSLFGV